MIEKIIHCDICNEEIDKSEVVNIEIPNENSSINMTLVAEHSKMIPDYITLPHGQKLNICNDCLFGKIEIALYEQQTLDSQVN